MVSAQMYLTQTVVTATPAKVGKTGKQRIMMLVVYWAANGTAEFKNAITDTGTVLLKVAGLASTCSIIDLSTVGGLEFDTGIWCNVTGTGNIAYVWFE